MVVFIVFVLAQPAPATWAVSPAARPEPVLRYEFTPRARELRPGNAAVDYLRAIALRPSPPADDKAAKALVARDAAFRDENTDAISIRELTEFLKPHEPSFRQLDAGARRPLCDWQRDSNAGGDALLSILPELQQHRELARMQSLRIRRAILDGKFEDAIEHLQTAFRHAHHVAHGPSLVQSLVGLAMMQSAVNSLDDWIRQPNSPNLCHALAALSRPLVNLRPALDGEEVLLRSLVPSYETLDTRPVSADQAVDAIERLITILPDSADATAWRALTTRVGIIGSTAFHRDDAKAELIKTGRSEASLAGMSPGQLGLLRAMHRCRIVMDEQIAVAALPVHDLQAKRNALTANRKELLKAADPLIAVLGSLVPGIENVLDARDRIERRIDLLKIIEEVRASPTLRVSLTEANRNRSLVIEQNGDVITISMPTVNGSTPLLNLTLRPSK